MRLAMWAKRDGRKILLSLEYVDGLANWNLTLKEGASTVFDGSGASLEEVTVMAVAALGKSL